MRNIRYKLLMLLVHGKEASKRAQSIVDDKWYQENFMNFDSDFDSYLHFFYKGWKRGHNPNPLFFMNDDGTPNKIISIENAGFIRGIIKGTWHNEEGFLPFFEPRVFLEYHEELKNKDSISLFLRYLQLGINNEFSTPPYCRKMVDSEWYATNHFGGKDCTIAPHIHFFHQGWKMGNNPHPAFCMNKDGSANVKISTTQTGRIREMMKGALAPDKEMLPYFDPAYYRANYPELGEPTDINAAAHFLTKGYKEGRIGCAPSSIDQMTVTTPTKPKHQVIAIQKTAPWNSPLIIAGFHRSGTSMTTEIFHEAGLFIGDDLLGANDSNKHGHFEDLEVIGFHDRLLKDAGTNWQVGSTFIPTMTEEASLWLANFGFKRAKRSVWGFKDPRVCLFLPIWEQAFPSLSVLYVYRPAIECVASLKRRAAADMLVNRARRPNMLFWREPDLALRMYLTYARASLRFLEGFKGNCWVVSLDNIKMGQDIIGPVNKSWGYELADVSVSAVYDHSAMTETTPNEAVKNEKLILEIRSVEHRFAQLINKGPQAGTGP